MRLALCADIHANVDALRSVVHDCARTDADVLVCLGDVTGYNALPTACVRLLRRMRAPCVAGNHDLMVTGRYPPPRGPNARRGIAWSQRLLTHADVAWLRALPLHAFYGEEILLVHARLDDPVTRLVTMRDYAAEAERLRRRLPAVRVCCAGHTHRPEVIVVSPWRGVRRYAGVGTVPLPRGGMAFVNPGTVGQPLDGSTEATYAVLDTRSRAVTFRRLRYDARRVAAANARLAAA